jgi:penicillin-binding protein 2
LFWLQIIAGGKYKRLAKENYIKPIVVEAPRGVIYDKKGIVLADNVPAYTLVIDSTKISHQEYEELIQLIGEEYRGRYKIRKISFPVVAKVEERKYKFPHISITITPLRRYVYSEMFSHLIGYVSELSRKDKKKFPNYNLGTIVGKAGVELQYEKFLKGKDGVQYIEVNAKGERQGFLSYIPPQEGAKLYLTISAELQEFVYTLLPPRSACVAMNPTDGSIIVYVSKPGFNSNLFSIGISSEMWNKLTSDTLAPLWDRVMKGKFPPASVFKLVTCASALEEGIITPAMKQPIGCNGFMYIGNKRYNCWETHGELDLLGAITYSCDVYFYQLGLQLGAKTILSYAKNINLHERTGIDLPGEGKGFLPSVSWYQKVYGYSKLTKGIACNLAIGQGEILTTPLEILYFISGIATNGMCVSPRVVDKIIINDDTLTFSSTKKTPLPWSSSTIEILRRGMLSVVSTPDGTGRLAFVPGLQVAGKTGTAQIGKGKETHAWFVAFAPYEEPEIVIVVCVEEGGMGGSVAAPIVGKILKRYFSIF